MLDESNIKASVSMITYNHEEFIAKAIDSILMQETNFAYEFIIGEDYSTDNTRNIVVDYKERYPDKIRLILNEKNLGMHKNSLQVGRECKGEYVAFIEGDDYWTSPHKLQKQVDFLDSHPECAICFHNAGIVYKDGSRDSRNYCPDDQKEISTLEDILVADFIPTCSTMFRRGLVGELPDWAYSVMNLDWAMLILHAQHGKIGYINEIMADFRSHPGGVWSRLNREEVLAALIHFYDTLNPQLDLKYRRITHPILRNYCMELSARYENMGDLTNARKYAVKCLRTDLRISRQFLRTFLRLYTPSLHKILKAVKRAL
jgi:glycosyltransferase involved in cell wall biosynthesis